MSSGQKPRTRQHFPQMKVRGRRRRTNRGWPGYYVQIVPMTIPFGGSLIAAMADMKAAAAKLAATTAVPPIAYRRGE